MSQTAHPPSDDGPLLEVSGLRKHFVQNDDFLDRLFGDAETVKAVDGVDLTVDAGETVGIVGESGCGKSTLAETVARLQNPTDGTIRYKGTALEELSGRKMKPYRREIQMIFQDPLSSLHPRQTVGEILTAPLEVHGIGDSDEERLDIAKSHIERVGLDPSHLDRYPNQFSGGQQQRIGIARALTLEPELIIADEPVSGLDVSVQAQILSLLNDIQSELGISIVFIAHDLSVIRYVADRVAVMYLGEIVERAPTDALFEDPAHPYTRALLSSVPRIEPEKRTDRIRLRGTVPSPLDPPSGCHFHPRCPAVIPPDDWPGDQEAFRAGLEFRKQLRVEEIDLDALRGRLDASTERITDADLRDELIAETLSVPLDRLPVPARESVQEAATAVVDGEAERAASLLADRFYTPCEERKPETVEPTPGHRVACHRVDPDAPGDPNRPEGDR
ncbi:ABC transporter ATP-binding protein [Halovivax cerinus]|uniref:ABC transporter ATP-binding protein n=1 Tax=Halovivax cerinus TaxID=1487865 RepID=A0ABD5NSA9_9EURY|nr:oligopeptide/dipeptide ABC transporter ATP-binding protein [Halovivax cerinus]